MCIYLELLPTKKSKEIKQSTTSKEHLVVLSKLCKRYEQI